MQDIQNSGVAKTIPVEDDVGSGLPVSVLPDKELHKDRHLASVGIVMGHGKVRKGIKTLKRKPSCFFIQFLLTILIF